MRRLMRYRKGLTIFSLNIQGVLQHDDIFLDERFIRHQIIPVLRFDVQSIDRFSRINVPGSLDRGNCGMIVKNLESYWIVILL